MSAYRLDVALMRQEILIAKPKEIMKQKGE